MDTTPQGETDKLMNQVTRQGWEIENLKHQLDVYKRIVESQDRLYFRELVKSAMEATIITGEYENMGYVEFTDSVISCAENVLVAVLAHEAKEKEEK